MRLNFIKKKLFVIEREGLLIADVTNIAYMSRDILSHPTPNSTRECFKPLDNVRVELDNGRR